MEIIKRSKLKGHDKYAFCDWCSFRVNKDEMLDLDGYRVCSKTCSDSIKKFLKGG